MSLDPKVSPVQEDDSLNNAGSRPARGFSIARHRVRTRFGGRLPHLGAALVVAVGLGVAGVTAATGGDGGERTDPAALSAAEERARAAAAARGDRGERKTPETGPTGSPTAADPTGDDGDSQPSPGLETPRQESPAPEASTPSDRSGQAQPAAAAPPEKETPDWVHPMPGAATTSCYGLRWGVLHAGIDLAMPADTPIRAAGAGTVIEAGWVYAGYGISVVIDHGDGLLTHYAHQNSTAVRVGDKVSVGQVIGYEGSTGDSTGPHLHFEVHDGLWNQLDPGPWMRDHGVDLGC